MRAVETEIKGFVMYIASEHDAYCPMREALCILPRHYAKWPISHISHNIYTNRTKVFVHYTIPNTNST